MLWSSRVGFLLSTIGISVGLGNVWRFPYVVGTNGGGAFVMCYLVSLLLFATPLLVAELMIGRRGGSNVYDGWSSVCRDANLSRYWNLLALGFVFAAIVALSYYSVVAGWLLEYSVRSAQGGFANNDVSQIQKTFSDLMASPGRMMLLQAIFLGLLIWILSSDINKRLELFNRIAMPLLAFILVVLVVFSLLLGDADQALHFLFVPDFSQITPDVLLAAMGQAFFSIGVAAGGIMAYGGYLSKDINIPQSSGIIALADTMVALLAGLAIFPLVFAAGIEPSAGPGLLFIALPTAVMKTEYGSIILTLFFSLVFVAALTTALSMLECGVRILVDRIGFSRRKSVWMVALVVWVLGLGSVFSFSTLNGFFPLGFLSMFESKTIFESLDHLVANILMPVNGLIIVVMVGWLLPDRISIEEYGGVNIAYKIWKFLIKYLAPVAIIFILFLL